MTAGSPFDVVDYLDSPRVIAAYLREAFAAGGKPLRLACAPRFLLMVGEGPATVPPVAVK